MNVPLPLPRPRACATTVSFVLAALMLAAPVAARAGTGTVTDPLVAPLLVPEPVSEVAPFRADRAPVARALWMREPSAIEAASAAAPAAAWLMHLHCVPTKAGPNWTDAHGRPPCETLRERVIRGW